MSSVLEELQPLLLLLPMVQVHFHINGKPVRMDQLGPIPELTVLHLF